MVGCWGKHDGVTSSGKVKCAASTLARCCCCAAPASHQKLFLRLSQEVKDVALLSASLCRYYVNRDTLFCYHKASEAFLQRLMALYVASHYKVNR